ncbi:MAG: hypothetical protein ACRETJ_04295, partial [Steroidobacteraceae bacterium]
MSDPVALGGLCLARHPGDWTPAKIEAAMRGTQTRRALLAKPIRVMILYGTVLASPPRAGHSRHNREIAQGHVPLYPTWQDIGLRLLLTL